MLASELKEKYKLVIRKFTREIEDNTKLVHKSLHQKETIYIGWVRLHIGWVKLNCYGAWKGSGTLAGCGGLLRDSDADGSKATSRRLECVMFFMLKCGACI